MPDGPPVPDGPARAVSGSVPTAYQVGSGVSGCREGRAARRSLRDPVRRVSGAGTRRVACPAPGTGRLGRGYGAGSSISAATVSWWRPAVPYTSASALARFRYRCAGCSQVMPMPPCNWTHSSAAWTAVLEQ